MMNKLAGARSGEFRQDTRSLMKADSQASRLVILTPCTRSLARFSSLRVLAWLVTGSLCRSWASTGSRNTWSLRYRHALLQ